MDLHESIKEMLAIARQSPHFPLMRCHEVARLAAGILGRTCPVQIWDGVVQYRRGYLKEKTHTPIQPVSGDNPWATLINESNAISNQLFERLYEPLEGWTNPLQHSWIYVDGTYVIDIHPGLIRIDDMLLSGLHMWNAHLSELPGNMHELYASRGSLNDRYLNFDPGTPIRNASLHRVLERVLMNPTQPYIREEAHSRLL